VSTLRLRPFFPPIRRVGADAFFGQGSFAHSSINTLPIPSDALHLVVFGQTGPPEFGEKTGGLPVLEMQVNGAGAAQFLGKGFPLASGAQNVNDGRKDLPCRHRFSSAARFAFIFPTGRPLARRNQRFHDGPKLIRYFPRLYLWHLGNKLLQEYLPQKQLLFTDKL
jgi:hypothetical protein